MMSTKKNSEEPVDRKKKLLDERLLAGGAGAVVALVAGLATRDPRSVIETIQHFGGPWLIGMFAIFVASQGAQRLMDIGERAVQAVKESAASQQNLADAVRKIADQDDRERVEQRRLLSYVGSQQEKILEKFEEMTRREEKARGAHA